MVRHIGDNDPRVTGSMNMFGIQMVYKSCSCRSYSCWLRYVRNKSLCQCIVYKISIFYGLQNVVNLY